MLETDGVEQHSPLQRLHPLQLVLVDNHLGLGLGFRVRVERLVSSRARFIVSVDHHRVAPQKARPQALWRLVGDLWSVRATNNKKRIGKNVRVSHFHRVTRCLVGK